MTGPPRKAVWVVAIVVLAVLAGYALYWRQPWTQIFETTVDDPLTTGVRVSGPEPNLTHTTDHEPYQVLSGTFVAQQHKTSGMVRVIRLPKNNYARTQLELVDFATSNGPGLRVWLSDQPVTAGSSGWATFDDGHTLDLGALKGNKGNQTYDVPLEAVPWSAALTKFRTVVIWSERLDVAYGAAALS